MLVIAICIALFLGVSFFSTVHALGLWLFLMIVHGVLVEHLGEAAVHLPLYSGMIVALVILVRRQWSGVSNGSLLLFGALIIAMVLATMQGMNLEASLVSMMLYAKVFLLALLLAGCLKSEKDIQVMTLYCLAGLLVGALVTVYQYKTGTFTVSNIYVQRAAGLRDDPNDTAMLLVAGVPLAIYWFMNTRKLLLKLFFAGSVPLLLIGIGLTGSRGGFVTLAVISLVIYLRRPTIQLTLMGLVMVAVAATLAPPSYWEQIGTLVTGKEEHGGRSLESRAILQKKGMSILMANPVLGVGPGNFGQAFMGNDGPAGLMGHSGPSIEVARDRALAAHNMYLEFAVENGIFADMLLLFIFFGAVRRLWAYDRYHPSGRKAFGLGFAIALALGGMLFAGMFLSQGKNSVLWFLIGLGFAAGQLTSRTRLKKTASAVAQGAEAPRNAPALRHSLRERA